MFPIKIVWNIGSFPIIMQFLIVKIEKYRVLICIDKGLSNDSKLLIFQDVFFVIEILIFLNG